MSETIDRMCDEASARLKHWIGTKAGIAKAQLGRNGYQRAYADLLTYAEDADDTAPILIHAGEGDDPLAGFRDKRGPKFDARFNVPYDLYRPTTPIYHDPFIKERQ